jgi:putative phage-type endonuclease
MVATNSTLSPSQLAERASGITATDIAAIIGVHPYRSAVNVWSDKRGESPAFEGNDRTKWGNLLEPVLRADYEERKGVRVEVHGTMQHRERPWMKATPDGLVYQRADVFPERGLEIKCHTVHLSYLYGAPGSDEVPEYELCQCTWNMAVTELPRWDLIAFVDGQPTDYVIDADRQLIDVLRLKAERFVRDYVQTGEPPPPDGSEAYSAWLATVNRSDNALAALVRVDGEGETMAAVERLRELRDEIAALEAKEGIVVQTLKARIGDNAGIEWPNGKPAPKKGKNKDVPPCDRITWKLAAGRSFTNYRGALEALQLRAQLLAGHGPVIDRALVALDKLAGVQFENSRATVAADDVRTVLAELRDFTVDAAKIQAPVVAGTGSRRFVVPRHWKTSRGAGDACDGE